MKLNPQEAPLYGDSVITVLLTEDDELEDDVVFYLLFAGSTLKHLTSTKKVDSGTLKTITPGHDCCETVKVSLCASKKGLPVLVVAEESFQFVQDEAYDAAQFLAASAGNQQALIFTRFLDRSRPPSEDATFLDEKVTLAFRHITLPEGWNVLGTGTNINEGVPQETLMHFAVRLGLLRLAWFLLHQPGGRVSLDIQNNEGATPISLALERGFQKLHQLLTDEKASEPDSWGNVSHVIHSGDFCVKHHRGLNVYTLTERLQEGAESSLENNIGELRKHIQNHSHQTNTTMQSQPELGTTMDSINLSEKEARDPLTEGPESEIPSPKESEDVSGPIPNVEKLSTHNFPVESSYFEIGDTVESNRPDSPLRALGGVIAESSCASINKDFETKKEEAGGTPIVASENISDKSDCTGSTPVGVNGVEISPSCGNTNTGTGMTLTGMVLNQESLPDIDNANREVKSATQSASVSIVAEETANQADSVQEFVDVDMGQAVSGNCTSVDGVQAQECMENEEHSVCTTGADLLQCHLCPEDKTLISAAERVTSDVIGRASDVASRTLDKCQEQDLPSRHVTCKEISGSGTNTEDINFKEKETHTENTENCLKGDVASAGPLPQEMPCENYHDGNQLLLTNEAQCAVGETPERDDSFIKEVTGRWSGKHAVENKENTATGLTGLCERDSTSTAENPTSDLNIQVDVLVKLDTHRDMPHDCDKTVTVLDAVESSKDTEDISPGTEIACRSCKEISSAAPENQETGYCKTENHAVMHETASVENEDPSSACSSEPVDEGSSSVEPLSPKAEIELLQNQPVITECDSGTEQQLHCLSGDITLEASAIELVQKEAVQEVELSLVSLLTEDGELINNKSRVPVPPTGDVSPVHSDNEVVSCNKGQHVQQDSLIDTPSSVHNIVSKENQEVAVLTTVLAEQSSVIIETALPASCQYEKELCVSSPFQPAVSEAEPSQVLCEIRPLGNEKVLSESAVSESSVSIHGKEPDVESSDDPDTGVTKGVSHQETDSGMAVDAKGGAVLDLIVAALDELPTTGDDRTLTTVLKQECNVGQGLEVIPLHGSVPESTTEYVSCEEAFVAGAEVTMTDNAEEEEEEEEEVEEESENVTISRASLHPIAEEPLSDTDSSQDTTSSTSESEMCPEVEEFAKDEPQSEENGADPNNRTLDLLLRLDTINPEHCVAHQGSASVKSFVQDLVGSVEVEDSINTTGTLTDQELEASLDFSGPCTAASTEDFSALEEEQSTSLSEEVPIEMAATPKEADSGLELSEHIEDDITSSGGVESEPVSETLDMKCEDEIDFAKRLQTSSETEQLINRESWCSIEPCPGPQLLEPKHTDVSTDCESFVEDGLGSECTSSQHVFQRESGSDSDIFHLSSEGMDDLVFAKPEEEQSACDITSSSSSADDTTSLERTSSRGSDISLPRTFSVNKHKNRHSLDSSCSSTTAATADGRENGDAEPVEMEGEEMDSITEVPVQAPLSRSSMRSLSPFRRHSWGPGKNTGTDTEINQRSSMRSLENIIRKSPYHRRSMSWCPSDAQCNAMGGDLNYRSYSLEGLAGDADDKNLSQTTEGVSPSSKQLAQSPLAASDEHSSLVYLSEEHLEDKQRDNRVYERPERSRPQARGFSYSTSALSPPLTKSMSLVTIHQPGLEAQGRTRPKRRISFSFNIPPLVPKSKHVYSIGSSSSDEESDSTQSLNSTTSSLAQSISEESCNQLPPSPSRKDLEGKGGTKVSRTFSYIKNKMSSKKTKEKEKDKDKNKEKEKDSKEKEKDKKTLNGHQFSTTPIVGPLNCYHCVKLVTCKDAYLCSNCNSIVHKGCRESYASCAKVKMKQQKVLQSHDTSSLPTVIMRNKNSQTRERPRSAIVVADENTFPMLVSNKRPQTSLSLSKSVSIQNIAGASIDENQLSTWKYLSHSTDSLNKLNSKVTESMESLNDEGTDMNEGQLMGDFEMDSKQLEAESWSQVVDSKFLRQQKKEIVKRQDVIYELMQTEMHHVRTLKIMSDVYSRGMMSELQFDQHMVEKIFPCLDDLLRIHFQFFQHILDRKKESMVETSDKNFVIRRIGDLLVNQFSGENAERMKKIYGKFCGHHNEAVNYFKDLHSKEKRFQAFMKRKMSSTVVRRLGIPECILLVTQRITKYPVLLQRILQYTKENEVEHENLAQSLVLVKDVITAVNSKVNNYEKKMRLHEIYSKTDSKSIQRMKSGKMFAKEDLKRRKLIRDGPVLLKTAAGRLKDVQAVLLSDTLLFLQEKDQKYVFASLEQKSTVISLKRLIVRDVAHEEKGLFLISMGDKDPEMVEVHASSKEERNSWIQIIQDTMNTLGKDEDEGVPSESEEERKMLDTKAKELKEQLQQKDKQILALLNEKEHIFRNLCSREDDSCQDLISRALFRAGTEESPKGEQIVKTAIKEVENLQSVVSRNLGGTLGHHASSPSELEGALGPISLPKRAETFGGFDSHQMTTLKNGEKDEVDDNQDLRRTESDGVLKKGASANLMFLLKRNNEQVLYSVSHLHELLSTLQAVVLQQDTYIEDQRLVLSERAISRTLSKPNSLIEQEKQRSLEKQRQELANLQKQQAHHLEEKRKREKEWEAREKELGERESRLAQREEQTEKGLQELEKEREELQARKEEYQRDLERLRAAQKQLEKETDQLKRDVEQVTRRNMETDFKQDAHHDKVARTSSMAGDSSKQPSSSSPKQDHLEPISPKRDGFLRTDSKHKGKGPFHLLTTTNQTNKPADRLFNLSKSKEKKEKKKKSKGGRSQPADSPSSETAQEGEEIFC